MTTPRRTFLQALLALVAAPFVRREKAKPKMTIYASYQQHCFDDAMRVYCKHINEIRDRLLIG